MKKILIANRGEIACRTIRSCRRLGLRSVAVYSHADESALHVEMADESIYLGGSKPADSYLSSDRILAVAREESCDAVYPGYGFLAENPEFAKAVEDAGIIWIGPRPVTIADMGDKERARLLAKAAGIPILPGSARFAPPDLDGLEEKADAVGYPLLVKAVAGGGGIGMQRVEKPDKLVQTVESTSSLAARAFGDGTIFLERFIPKARHIEIQVFGFGDGTAIHLYERECSIQRRYQKIIEESPSPGLSATTRDAMTSAAIALAEQERYRGAGTIEFIFDESTGDFFFLEMNTRIQVEHPVTEMITGYDLIGLQIQLAAGDDLGWLKKSSVPREGHAIECRLYAENPQRHFFPSPGQLEILEFPDSSNTLRVDSGVRQNDRITPYYDPMIAKVIGSGPNRESARVELLNALRATTIKGVATNLQFLIATLQHPSFISGDTHTHFIQQNIDELTK